LETHLLRDQQVYPTEDVLRNAMGESYAAFEELMDNAINNGLAVEWHYYNDGKAWLCKAIFKKKTIFWLSVWEKSFKTSFFFSEKNSFGVADLDIEETIKKSFQHSQPIGRLFPLIIHIFRREQIPDVLKIMEYKKGLK
jgi:hypothetical protein